MTTQTTQTLNLTAGIARLEAWEYQDGYLYEADETGECHIVTRDAVIDLGAHLRAGVVDAYSHWCSGGSGRAAPVVSIWGEGEGEWEWESWMDREHGEDDATYLSRVCAEAQEVIIGHDGYADEDGNVPSEVETGSRHTAIVHVELADLDGAEIDSLHLHIASYSE